MIAQYGCGWVRVLFLSLSAIAYGYEAFLLFRKGQSKRMALVIFVTAGILLPSVAIGYNQYTVLGARKVRIDTGCAGTFITLNIYTDKYGLRDRYGEIAPCSFDMVYPVNCKGLPLVKVRQGKHWGLYDLDRRELAVEPAYIKIEKHSENFLRLIAEDGCNRYLQVGLYARSRHARGESWEIVDIPNDDLARESVEPAELPLEEKKVENRVHFSRIYNYIVSTYLAADDGYDYDEAGVYWRWAAKCTKVIENIARENDIFISDTARVSEQASCRIADMLDSNCYGTQTQMNSYSLVESVMQFYLAIDNNRQLEKMDSVSWDSGFKEEYELWMDFCLKSYVLYADVILKDESYQSLPLELNGVLSRNSVWRAVMLKENIAMLGGEASAAYSGAEATDDDLKAYIRKMDDNRDEPCHADELRVSMLKWLRHRDNMAENLDSRYREAFAAQTKRIRRDLCGFLEEWTRDFESYKATSAIRARMAEDESDKMLFNDN